MSKKSLKDSLQLNKPRRTPNHPTKSHVVKINDNGTERLIRFGQQGVSTAGKPKKGESKNKRPDVRRLRLDTQRILPRVRLRPRTGRTRSSGTRVVVCWVSPEMIHYPRQ